MSSAITTKAISCYLKFANDGTERREPSRDKPAHAKGPSFRKILDEVLATGR